ncbi:TetR family transcriptional regulator [Haloactinomyces albus]|uniref:AcrR family transcriptional regulator n=1 Tax=Haloactinomyces albus TaxID=1352928 RepID=A0AAE3Z7V7_9ACTN|nr:TetR family transcriptional regulator [Haloactinomyces albus]MDR7299943.1 AcrR family transcriptional regulator [Haloactinomyces albus]
MTTAATEATEAAGAAEAGDDTAAEAPMGRRQRKAIRTRASIEDAALRLFTEQGFDATTVEQIAEAADIAPRTFFRYFPSKDAVLFGDLGGETERMRTIMDSRASHEHPMRSLAAAMLDAAERMEPDREQHLMRAELLHALDNAGDYELHLLRQQWMQDVTNLVAEHLGVDSGTDPRPGAWSMTLVSCFGSAMHAWLVRTDDSITLRHILSGVLAATSEGLEQATDEIASAPR